jgi:hypothetical protein
MSIKTNLAALALATIATAGTIASTTSQAEAKNFGPGFGIGAAIVGAAVVGGAIAANQAGYYDGYGYGYGYRHCGFVPQYDAYGNYVGRIRTCNY